MSYRESMGRANAALYALRYPRTWDSSVGFCAADAPDGASMLR